MQRQKVLTADWTEAAEQPFDPGSEQAKNLVQRQFDWLSGVPGTPSTGTEPTREYFIGLGDMYVADERFGANYGGPAGAAFVRDAMAIYAERNL